MNKDYSPRHAYSSRNEMPQRGSFINRLSRAARKRLGKTAVVALLSLGAAGGISKAVSDSNERHRAQYEVVQDQIAPVIAGAMIDIDTQTLEMFREHPDQINKIDNPDGRTDAVEFITDDTNTVVIMGKTEKGTPDPNQPLYVSYYKIVGAGAETGGVKIRMTAPGGNQWVDELSYSGFGGSTEGGWGAVSYGGADTTDRGFRDSGPAPLEAAQEIADLVGGSLGPFEPNK